MNKKIKVILSTISPKLETYISYYYNFHEFLNLKNPYGINQKLQYLKLKTYYNNPIITQCVDKYRVRDYIKEIGFEKILPNLIGVYNSANDVRNDWDKLPNKFVIKCNHGCGYNILVKDKMSENIDDIVNKLSKWMKEDYWKIYCEPQYKFVKKKIIIESYLGDNIQTYKFYCFNGVPKVSYVSTNGENDEKDLYLDYYDIDWNWLPITLENHLHSKEKIEKPINYEKMVDLAKKLSNEFPFVRVDLYNINGTIYFSELTFIPTGGMMKLKPKDIIYEWGNLLNLK